MNEELPQGWIKVQLSEICLPVSQCGPAKDKRTFRYIDLGALDNKAKRIGKPSTVAVAVAPSRAKQVLQTGDVVFSTVRVYLENIALIPEELDGEIASTAFCVLRPASGVDPRFLYYFVTSRQFVLEVNRFQRGNSPPSVQDGDVRSQSIPLAPTNEQPRIVSKLDELFSRIEEGERALKRVQKLAERYRQSVLKAAVAGELTQEWREKRKGQLESGESLLARILKARREAWEKAELDKMKTKGITPVNDEWRRKYREPFLPDTSDLPELPEGWVWASLDQLLVRIEAGKSFRCEERPPKDSEFGVVKVSAVTWGRYNEFESKTITDTARLQKSYLVKAGDFLFSRANTLALVGASVIVHETTRRLLLSDKILRFVFAVDLKQWVDTCLKSNLGRAQIEALSTGNQESMRNIGQERIGRIAIPLPSESEIEHLAGSIANEVMRTEYAVAAVGGELKRASALRQSTLASAFCGTLVSQDLADECASVLLERIAAERDQPGAPERRRPKKKTKRTA